MNPKLKILCPAFLKVLFVLFLEGVLIQHQLVVSNWNPFQVEHIYLLARARKTVKDPVSPSNRFKICFPNHFVTFLTFLAFLTGFLLGLIPQFSPLIPVEAFENFASDHAIVIVAAPAQDGI
jgi:hypothetical protein